MIDGQFIGIDVGGTKVAVTSLEGGRFTAMQVEPTVTTSAAGLVEQLAAAIERVRTPSARAVGIGVPSVVEFATGRIRTSVNIPLQDVPLRTLLTERVGLPVFVDNDANCAALAEAYEDGHIAVQHLVMFTVGTGVGGGAVLGGRVFRGATGAALEIGHIIIGLDLEHGAPEPGGYPQPGSLEALASGRALDRLALAAARAHPASALGEALARTGVVAGREAVEAAMAGDAVAQDVIHRLGERLGIGIANAINIFDPLEVVIGGGVSTAGDMLLRPATETARKFTLAGVGTETRIRLARQGVQAGVMGAALTAAQEIRENEVAVH